MNNLSTPNQSVPMHRSSPRIKEKMIHGREVLPPGKPNAARKKMQLVPLLQKEPRNTKLAAKFQKKTKTMTEFMKQINNQHCPIGKKKDNTDSDDDKVDNDNLFWQLSIMGNQ
jgi:hypothetical protein